MRRKQCAARSGRHSDATALRAAAGAGFHGSRPNPVWWCLSAPPRPLGLIDLRGDGPVRIGAPSAVVHDGNADTSSPDDAPGPLMRTPARIGRRMITTVCPAVSTAGFPPDSRRIPRILQRAPSAAPTSRGGADAHEVRRLEARCVVLGLDKALHQPRAVVVARLEVRPHSTQHPPQRIPPENRLRNRSGGSPDADSRPRGSNSATRTDSFDSNHHLDHHSSFNRRKLPA